MASKYKILAAPTFLFHLFLSDCNLQGANGENCAFMLRIICQKKTHQLMVFFMYKKCGH